MKLNKLSLSLAITLALGSTFGMAHAETTAAQKPKYLMLLQKRYRAKTDVKRIHL